MAEVEFCEKVKVTIINLSKEERKNPYYKKDCAETFKITKQIGRKNLVYRSLCRADEQCSCFNKCECTQHNHENISKNMYGVVLHCANASLLKCPNCPKLICEICFDMHLKREQENLNLKRQKRHMETETLRERLYELQKKRLEDLQRKRAIIKIK